MSDQLSPEEAAAMEAALAAARSFNTTLWTLYAIGILVTMLRTYARIKAVGWKRLEGDDYMAWVSALLYTLQNCLGYQIGALAHGLANNGMTDAQRAVLPPDSPEYIMRVAGSKIQVAGWSSYSTLITALKLSMLFFYLRLTNGLSRNYRLRVKLGFVLVLAGYIAAILAILLSCRPFHHNWQISPDPGNLCQPAVSQSVVWASFAANITSDIYLVLIPLPLLWGSRMRMVEKVASTFVLGAGIFVLVCATLKTVFVVTDEVNGAELAGAWGTREAFVAVVTTNLPMVFPLFKTWLRPILGNTRGSSSKQYKRHYKGTPEGFRTIGGGDGGSGNGVYNSSERAARSSKHNHPSKNVLTNVSFTESEERIIETMKMQNMKTAGDKRGIVVESKIVVDVSDEPEHGGDGRLVGAAVEGQRPARVHEPW